MVKLHKQALSSTSSSSILSSQGEYYYDENSGLGIKNNNQIDHNYFHFYNYLNRTHLKINNWSEIEEFQFIGQGSCGLVKEGLHKPTQTRLALKYIPIQPDSEQNCTSLLTEITTLISSSKCDSIVNCYNAFVREMSVVLVLEYMIGGSLADLMRLRQKKAIERRKEKIKNEILQSSQNAVQNPIQTPVINSDLTKENKFAINEISSNSPTVNKYSQRNIDNTIDFSVGVDEKYIALIVRQLLSGLLFLHREKRIIHRDLKLANCLISGSRIALADFGVSGELSQESELKSTFTGTLTSFAPERLKGEPYTFSCDIWFVKIDSVCSGDSNLLSLVLI